MEDIKNLKDAMKNSFIATDQRDKADFEARLEKLSMETLENAEIGVLHDLTPARWAIYRYSNEKGYFEAIKMMKANMYRVSELPEIIDPDTLVERLKDRSYRVGTLDFNA